MEKGRRGRDATRLVSLVADHIEVRTEISWEQNIQAEDYL